MSPRESKALADAREDREATEEASQAALAEARRWESRLKEIAQTRPPTEAECREALAAYKRAAAYHGQGGAP